MEIKNKTQKEFESGLVFYHTISVSLCKIKQIMKKVKDKLKKEEEPPEVEPLNEEDNELEEQRPKDPPGTKK